MPRRFLNSQKTIPFLVSAYITLGIGVHAVAQCSVDAGNSASICQGESVTLGGNPTIIAAGGNPSVTWNNGAANVANPTVSPSSTTTYTVTLTSDGGCETTDQVTVVVNPAPTAAFTFNPSGACSSSPVQFINNSSGSGLTYSWNFGNSVSGPANTSTANNPSHQFIAPGNGNTSFNVTLTVTDVNGCTSSVTQNVPVIQSPDASLTDAYIFTPFVMCGTSGQNAFDITVNNTSSTQATNVNYTLDWGDGSAPVSGPDLSTLNHTYVGTGFFDLTFTVEGANGCVTTRTYEVYADSNPSVGLASPGSTINLCAPNTLVFPITNWQNNSDGTVYTVTFSDGSEPEVFIHPPPESISHVFETSSCGSNSIGGFQNSFHALIIAQNTCGFSAATIEPIQTSSAPTTDITVLPGPEGCAGSPLTFVNSSTNANFNNNGNCVSLTTANWSIEPATGWTVTGGSLTDPSSFNAVFEPGEYTITAVVANPCGSDEISTTVLIGTPCLNPCEIAEPITCGDEVSGTTLGEPGFSLPFCGTGTGSGGSIWYSILGNGQIINADLCNSNFDTKIWVFEGGDCDNLICIGGNDDFSGCGLNAQFEWLAEDGLEYFIVVGGFGSNEGEYILEVTCDCQGNALDECGVCGGNGIPNGFCDCYGNVLDECGVCGGNGIPNGFCDCDGNVLDECAVCGGNGIPDGFCDCSGNILDECGVCGGNGIPDGFCDCDGNNIAGCTDTTACNFSVEAGCDDGSCWWVESFSIEGPLIAESFINIDYFYPGPISSTYSWFIENGIIIDGQGTNNVTVLWGAQSYGLITIQETSINGCLGEIITQSIEITPTHVDEINSSNIHVFPNPTRTDLVVDIKGNTSQVMATFYDTSGRAVLVEQFDSYKTINVGSLSKGTYVLSLSNDYLQYRTTIIILD